MLQSPGRPSARRRSVRLGLALATTLLLTPLPALTGSTPGRAADCSLSWTAEPANAGTVTADAPPPYDCGSTPTLLATPAPGWHFETWTGATPAALTRDDAAVAGTFTVEGALAVTAHFAPDTAQDTVRPAPTLAGAGTPPQLLSVAALALTLLTLGTVALVRSRFPRAPREPRGPRD
ncbi:InlB B-repeat-containing protein [Kitasatospora sp. LaBMicrA B282]|uniref:InlB B-repeat-containing protein n=1 Tax=Kitasatospora sp. LaBMicrA B282 TaxID=3420949 RepID=UPI003D0F5336